MRKGQSISIDTIIVAAIAILVLVIVVMIFTNRLTIFRIGASDCYSSKGVCINADEVRDKCSQDYQTVRRELKCFKSNGDEDTTKVCCLST